MGRQQLWKVPPFSGCGGGNRPADRAIHEGPGDHTEGGTAPGLRYAKSEEAIAPKLVLRSSARVCGSIKGSVPDVMWHQIFLKNAVIFDLAANATFDNCRIDPSMRLRPVWNKGQVLMTCSLLIALMCLARLFALYLIEEYDYVHTARSNRKSRRLYI